MAKNALVQIDKEKYVEELLSYNVHRILALGLAFQASKFWLKNIITRNFKCLFLFDSLQCDLKAINAF